MLAKQTKILGMLLFAGILLLVFTIPASAASTVAVVDVNKAVSECKSGRRAQADIKQRFERLNAEISKMGEELQAMQQDFQKQAAMMNDAAKLKRQQEIEAKFQTFNQRRMQAQKEIADAERAALAPILEKLKTIIDTIGKGKYDLILDARNTIYCNPAIDITAEVTKALDRAIP